MVSHLGFGVQVRGSVVGCTVCTRGGGGGFRVWVWGALPLFWVFLLGVWVLGGHWGIGDSPRSLHSLKL